MSFNLEMKNLKKRWINIEQLREGYGFIRFEKNVKKLYFSIITKSFTIYI